MTAPQLEPAVANAQATMQLWDAAMDQIATIRGRNDEALNLFANVPGVSPPMSLSQIGNKVSATLELIGGLSQVESAVVLPDSLIGDLVSHSGGMKTYIEQLKSDLDGFLGSGNVISIDSINITAQNSGGRNINISNFIPKIVGPQMALVSAQLLRVMTGVPEATGFADAVSRINRVRNNLRRTESDLSAFRKQFTELKEQIAALAKRAQKDADNATSQMDAAAAARSDADAAASSANEALNKIHDVLSQTAELKHNVEGYKETFDEFQTKLEARNARFENGKAELGALVKRLIEAETDVDRIRSKARDVLGEATVSGLSDRFFKEASSIGRRLWLTQIFLGFSILLLAGSALVVLPFPWLTKIGLEPLASVPPPADVSTGAALVYFVNNSLGKLVFLVPAAFLVVFTARRAVELFLLKSQYTYKYTVAASLPGFKVEAPTYAEAINASAFKELLYDPASIVHGHGTRKLRNTWIERLLEPRIKVLLEKMLDSVKQ